MNKKTVFFNNLCDIDHTIVNDSGTLVGGSYKLSVVITGELEDFNHIKSMIIELIDHEFANKLWVIPSYSQCMIVLNTPDKRILRSSSFELEAPRDSINIVECNFIGSVVETMQRAIQHQLWISTQQYGLSIEVKLTENMLLTGGKYNHKFRHITATESNVNGYYGWVEIEHDTLFKSDCFDCQRGIQSFNEIGAFLQNTIFVNVNDIKSDIGDILKISFKTFELSLNKAIYNIVILETELLEFVYNKWGTTLSMGHVKAIVISKGLSNGTIKRFSY